MDKIKDRKVLIVDDSKLMRLLLNNIIDSMKYFSEIYEAENGREALDLLELKKVDLILLDIEMPVMDGVEALKEIRFKILEGNKVEIGDFQLIEFRGNPKKPTKWKGI